MKKIKTGGWMKMTRIFLFMSLAVIFVMTFCSQKSEFQKGVEALGKGEYALAVRALKAASVKEPSNPEVFYGLCIAYGNLDSTVRAYGNYLKLSALNSPLKEDLSLKAMLANFLNLDPFPASPIPMAKLRNQFKGSPAPDQELIAVAAAKLDNGEIFLVKYDGSIVKKISRGGMNTDPDFSPRGDKVVYVSNQDGDDELYVYDITTQKTDKLTDNRCQDISPSISPVSKEVVYASDLDGAWDIYSVNLVTKKIARLTNNKYWDGFPHFAPDGQWITFSSKRDGSDDIYTMRSNGTDCRLLYASNGDDDDASLVGDDLFFRSTQDGEWEIYRLTMKSRLLIRLTHNDDLDWNPRVSPGGKRLLLTRQIKNRWRLYFINLENSIPSGVIMRAIDEHLPADTTSE
jgi:dipeptidyl aminopeptidase/acylaminoacyl peptidase